MPKFAMRTAFVLLLALLLSLAHSVFAQDGTRFELVFVPEGAVDYVATFKEINAIRQGEPRTVFQRARSTRLEIDRRNGKTITFEGRSQPNLVHLTVDASGRYRGLHIKPPDQHSMSAARAVRTDRLQSFLNETCRIWNMPFGIDANAPMLRESCVTDDGIELWHKLISHRGLLIGHIEATSVERRTVGDMEMLPPADLLNLKSWGVTDDAPSIGKTPTDFEIILRPIANASEPAPNLTKTVRRSFPWSRTETTTTEYRRLEFDHAAAKLRLEIGGFPDAFRYLHILRYDSSWDGETVGEKLNRTETVLGESCDWYDRHPRMMDASLHQCRASDGIVLKEISGSRGRDVPTIEAVQVRRAPASIAGAAPPDEVLRSAYWRIPQ